MRIGVIIPTRNDRPRFLSHCRWLLLQQTIQPDVIALMDYPPESNKKDITQRYRRGYDQLRGQNLDAILLFEEDDWYHSQYIETMVKEWESAGRPDLFGPRYTEYYHIKNFEHFTMLHEQRSSAMSTLIKPDLNFVWPPDHEPYTDTWLWMRADLRRELFTPPFNICLGIKHGEGLCGGEMHTTQLGHYKAHGYTDSDKSWLRSVVDPVSFKLYCNYFIPNNS